MHHTALLKLQLFVLEVAAEDGVKQGAIGKVHTHKPGESDADNGVVAAGWG
jgi:hypothetical protein